MLKWIQIYLIHTISKSTVCANMGSYNTINQYFKDSTALSLENNDIKTAYEKSFENKICFPLCKHASLICVLVLFLITC